MGKQNATFFHIAALLTIIVWGTTMVATKILLHEGLSPEEIMLIRFLVAYIFLWILYPRTHKVKSWSDELTLFGMGVTSGSAYFFFENTALVYTSATNVAIIGALIPLLTAIFTYVAFRENPLTRLFWTGSAISVAGAVLVILNGNFSLNMNPTGDFLALLGIVSWSVYGVLSKCLKGRYSSLFITRNIFFYGILTLLPYFVFEPFDVPVKTLLKPSVLWNLVFLGFVASSMCYFLWTFSLKKLGVVKTNNYIYFSPLITIITAGIVLNERITVYIVCGTAFIICGLLIANTKK
ncbi:MAG: DMT family transporter [Prevotellaceae bacterium]|jgi:drug/metabolite transporter (DMT)-like permease|nr:DMT family transporter [Prevotellaceae bacterium]